MALILITIFFILLQGFTVWMFLSHIKRLEVFIKAKTIDEAMQAMKPPPKDTAIKPEGDEESSLSETFAGKSPDEIRSAFK
jgi:hypothetical protein